MKQPTPVLQSLQNDLQFYSDYLRGIAREILDSELSKYPIFVAYQSNEVKIGKQVLAHQSLQRTWSINASVLEELIQKKIVTSDRIQSFRKTFKDPENFICVLTILGNEASFVFYPYPKTITDEFFEDE